MGLRVDVCGDGPTRRTLRRNAPKPDAEPVSVETHCAKAVARREPAAPEVIEKGVRQQLADKA